ncbi:MAG: hypothetical protein VZQ29_07215, partial [Succiniclasticum sp.]|nr:hypothetical protein [Succiniclasticum sp.]
MTGWGKSTKGIDEFINKIKNKKQACKVSQNRSCLLFHGLMRLWLRNSGLRPSNSLATAAHFVSWNVANTPDVLLKPCTLAFYFR